MTKISKWLFVTLMGTVLTFSCAFWCYVLWTEYGEFYRYLAVLDSPPSTIPLLPKQTVWFQGRISRNQRELKPEFNLVVGCSYVPGGQQSKGFFVTAPPVDGAAQRLTQALLIELPQTPKQPLWVTSVSPCPPGSPLLSTESPLYWYGLQRFMTVTIIGQSLGQKQVQSIAIYPGTAAEWQEKMREALYLMWIFWAIGVGIWGLLLISLGLSVKEWFQKQHQKA